MRLNIFDLNLNQVVAKSKLSVFTARRHDIGDFLPWCVVDNKIMMKSLNDIHTIKLPAAK
jgi:hypothetical protein